MELFEMTAASLSQKLRNKEVSAVEITKSALAQIKKTEDQVQSFGTVCEDSALAKAAEVDAKLAAGEALPDNVVCALADCGYSSAKEIISKVMKEMHLPPWLVYPLVRLGGRLFGGFDPDETSPMEAVKKSRIPIIFIHGDNDAFVPYEMSVRLHEACVSPKALQLIKGAGHGLAYPVDKQTYIDALVRFEQECGFLK